HQNATLHAQGHSRRERDKQVRPGSRGVGEARASPATITTTIAPEDHTMRATVKNWIMQNGDIGSYRVTVTIYGPTVTVALTFAGPLTRKKALVKAWEILTRENRWSPHFLNELRSLFDRPRRLV